MIAQSTYSKSHTTGSNIGMIEQIEFNGENYPKFQSIGNAAQFAIPFAKHVCKGTGYDIGCNRKEWAFPGATLIDDVFDDPWDAYNLPPEKVDYIFSSHCLEHLPNWVDALQYWIKKLNTPGVLFLYLPHKDQKYWKPWHNRKHIHYFTPDVIHEFLLDNNMSKIYWSKRDLNHSFMIMAEK